MRVFPDANVLISAFLSNGTCFRLITRLIGDPGHELVIGAVVLDEAKRILREKIKAPEHEIEAFVRILLGDAAARPVPDYRSPVEVRDADDVWVLASALEAGADALVTGDRDLLDVASDVEALRILTPRSLWDELQPG